HVLTSANFDVWRLIDTGTGRELARSEDDLLCIAASRALRPDGREVAFCNPIAGSRKFRITVLSLPDFAKKTTFEVDGEGGVPPRLSYTAACRFLEVSGNWQGYLWDLHGERPTAVDKVMMPGEGAFHAVAS